MKKLLLVLVAVATVAFVSCKKEEGDKAKDTDKAQTEQVAETPEAEAEAAPEVTPTGDMDADIQTVIELTVNNIKHPSVKGNKELEAVNKAFEEFYKAQGEQVYNDYAMKLGGEMLSNKEINEAMEKALEMLK